MKSLNKYLMQSLNLVNQNMSKRLKLSQSENIIERLRINKDISPIKYNYYPKDYNELRSLLEQLLEERGKDADLNDIDTSQITTFYDVENRKGLFQKLNPHNIDISRWDVSNVKNMSCMFYNCNNFDCDLSNWDVSNVNDMYCMFYDCKNFTGQGLENWDVSNVKNMQQMFWYSKKFDCNLSNWKVDKVENMWHMFSGCDSLKKYPNWY